MRLDKYLCEAGLGTRSQVKKLLKSGAVTVNGQTAVRPEQKIKENDRVAVSGRELSVSKMEYWMLNKPAGCVSATEDSRFQTVLDFLPEGARRDLFPAGRLDRDTEGLLLITNDGMLAHELLAPARHVEKTYFLRAEGIVTEDDRIRLEQGVDIGEEKPTLPARAEILKRTGGDGGDPGPGCTELLLSICEGKFHQVKRMMEAVGKPVIYLKRVSMGPLTLPEDLKKGECRPLTEQEVTELKQAGKK